MKMSLVSKKRGPVHGKVKIPVISSIAQTIVHQYICWDGWWQNTLLLGQKAFAWNLFSDQVGEKASLRTSGGYCLFFLSTKRRLRKSRKCLRRKGNGGRKGENTDMLSLSEYSKNTKMLSEKFCLVFLYFPSFLGRPVRQLSSLWMAVWLECWLTDSPCLTKRNTKTSVISKRGYSQSV